MAQCTKWLPSLVLAINQIDHDSASKIALDFFEKLDTQQMTGFDPTENNIHKGDRVLTQLYTCYMCSA